MSCSNGHLRLQLRRHLRRISQSSISKSRLPYLCESLLVSAALVGCWSVSAYAQIADVTVADVTTRAFSLIWVADDFVDEATVRVYSDANGDTEVTNELNVALVSTAAALERGIVKVDVWGAQPDTTYYLETETMTSAGSEVFPAASDPLIEALTAVQTTKALDTGEPIVNDILAYDFYDLDGLTPTEGGLVLISIPGVSAYPLSALSDNQLPNPRAIVDLNNAFEAESGVSAEVPALEVLEVTEYRGIACDPSDQALVRLRRAPAHEEQPPITELESPESCYSPNGVSADFDCDGRIGLVDFTRFSAKFDVEVPDCKFNPDFDLNNDGRVGLPDFTRFSSVFGLAE